jgi:ribonuclease T2
MRRWSGILALILLFASPAEPRSRRNQPRNPAAGEPGQFDYYVLSLSWSPQYCANPDNATRDPEQCGSGRRYAFVTHGLWPNNNRPPHPRNCASRSNVAPDLTNQMLSIMPSPALIQHEWNSHGTCSGLNQRDYFAAVRAAYRLVSIPEPYRQPAADLRISADEIRRNFYTANAQFPRGGLRLDCSGQYLRELRICLDKKLRVQACGSAVHETCGSRIVTLRRVR